MLLEINTLPICNYETKKILHSMSLEYQKIHACPNDCVLYKDEFASLKVCPTCVLSQFKKKIDENSGDEDKDGPPLNVVWCVPIIPWLKRLFAIKKDVKNLNGTLMEESVIIFLDSKLILHNGRRLCNISKIRCKPKNIRIGLATDGMKFYENISSKLMIILQRQCIVVYFCSLHRKMKHDLISMLQT